MSSKEILKNQNEADIFTLKRLYIRGTITINEYKEVLKKIEPILKKNND